MARTQSRRMPVTITPNLLRFAAALCALAVLVAPTVRAGVTRPVVSVTVVEDSPQHVVLEYDIGDYAVKDVSINGETWERIDLGTESHILRAGAPDLPDVRRSIIIPDDSVMGINVVSSEFYEVKGISVAPSKGNLLRTVNPDDVPFVFDEEVYGADAFYPERLAALGDPYILRDYRGLVVRVSPLQYNPATKTLRVYTSLTVEVAVTGAGGANVLRRPNREKELSLAFHQLYQHHFLNYGNQLRYPPLDEAGDMLIICYDAWIPNMASFVNHKNSIGINTSIVGISTIGNSVTSIENYIQDVYDTSDLAFVLLVGDAAQIATPWIDGGASDPTYAKVAGSDDYPDIMVGRFSAETAAQVDTQVQRTIDYENMPATEQDWFWRGTGIGSDQGAGIGDEGQADYVHEAEIRTWLLGAGYTQVDQIYDPGATSSSVRNAVNAGRGIINYTGHGWEYGWSTTGFSSSDVNSLTNDDMLPFIVSVACANGDFTTITCFAETWLRATNNSTGEPTGAIGIYASSVNCSWAPPMEMQDEFNLLYTDEHEPYHAFGTLCFAGSCSAIDAYGSSGVTIFNEYHVFGDPSVRVVGTVEPPTGLRVTGEDFASSGHRGGPYTPDSAVYTLQNNNDTPMDYEVTASVSWVDISNDSGTLAGGATIDVTVSLNAEADTLGHGLHEGTLNFVNLTDHDGDDTRAVSIDVDAMDLQYEFNMDADPGWTAEGDWAFGQPIGEGTHDGDPASGYTGQNVYGFNLAGDYASNLPERHLTTTALDCSGLTHLELRFQRWLGVESSQFDHASIEVSSDGTNWTQVWTNPSSNLSDSAWILTAHDISAVADGQPAVYIRWTMGTTDGSVTYPGWNIDDVEIWGVSESQPIPGDLDGDGDVDLGDLSILLANYGLTDGATYEDGDLDGDGDVDLSDLSLLLANYGL